MSTLCMEQHYLLHSFFQKSTWIFAEKYKYIINFPVTNIKNENNCIVLQNYPVPSSEFARKTWKLLKPDLDGYTSVALYPSVNINQLSLLQSFEKLHYFPLISCFCCHRRTQIAKASQPPAGSMPSSHPIGLGQVGGKSSICPVLLCWHGSAKQLPHASELDHRRGRAGSPGGCQPRAGLPLAAARSKPQTGGMQNRARAAHFFLLGWFQSPLHSPEVLSWLGDTFCMWTVLVCV